MFEEVIGSIFYWSGQDLMSLYVPEPLEEVKHNSKSILKDLCLHCQSFCDHDTVFCPERTCKKCGENGHIKLNCMKNMENMPLADEMVLKIFSYLNKTDLANVAQVSKRLKRISNDKSLNITKHGAIFGKIKDYTDCPKDWTKLSDLNHQTVATLMQSKKHIKLIMKREPGTYFSVELSKVSLHLKNIST